MEKKCFKCGKVKPLTDFYKHKKMADGHLNKCKTCTIKDSENQRQLNLKKDGWHEKEKARHRDKYYRLNYKEKHKPNSDNKKIYLSNYYNKFPEKLRAKTKSTSLKKEGYEKHHWNYKEGFEKDVIWLKREDHYKLHRYLKYNKQNMVYQTMDGVLLDTKNKHYEYFLKINEL